MSEDRTSESAVRSSYGYTVPRRFLWFVDLAILCAAFLVARLLAPLAQALVAAGGPLQRSFSWLSPRGTPDGVNLLGDVVWILLVMGPATLLFMQLAGGYRPLLEQSRAQVALASFASPLLGLSLVSLVLMALKIEQTSRAFVFLLALLTAVGFFGYRSALRRYKRKRLNAGFYARNVVVIGSAHAAALIYEHFDRVGSPHFHRLCGHLSVPGQSGASPASVAASGRLLDLDNRCLGSVAALGDILVHRPIHEVVAVESAGSAGWLHDVADQCRYFRTTLRIVPEDLLAWSDEALPFVFRSRSLRLPEIVLEPPDFDSDVLFVKRVIDIVVSSTLLVLLSPLFLLLAIAIKLTTPHLPVLYPWRVVGYKGRAFTGYKFTTMEADADDRKAALMHLNEMSGPVFKIKDDPRITPLGRYLRKFSINELPQLWSVLKGDMSLVGPRPAYPNELARYELWHKRKLCVQPGITCLWQIRGRNAISNFDDWVRMDLEYIDRWSLWLDLKIMACTVWAIAAGTGS
jgi:exopolysaccharide biosynthesis polyprenyl glycosylphosphotransferase